MKAGIPAKAEKLTSLPIIHQLLLIREVWNLLYTCSYVVAPRLFKQLPTYIC